MTSTSRDARSKTQLKHK